MSTMADLEALSNKELRQKCLEHGMPNVPVTDTSRKILIRRLEAVMSGKPIAATTTKNTRRETMHVTKSTEVASSPKIKEAAKKTEASNRPSRRTIAVPERHIVTTTTVSEPEYSDVSPDRIEVEPVKTKAKTPEKPAALYPKLPAKEPSPKPQQLSKTGVVTTSYVQETTPISKTYGLTDDVVFVEDDYDDAYMEEEQNVKKPVSNPTKLSYVPVAEPRVTTSGPFTKPLSTSTRYSTLGSTDYNKPNYLSTANVHSNYIPPQYKRTYQEEAEEESEDEDENEEDEVVLVEDSPIKEEETPFLSQFARNLEHIKATPLRHSIGPTKIATPSSALRNRDYAYNRRTIATPLNITTRRSINQPSSFRLFVQSMEEKYHLKHSLIMISIFILAVFIYVFFIQSV